VVPRRCPGLIGAPVYDCSAWLPPNAHRTFCMIVTLSKGAPNSTWDQYAWYSFDLSRLNPCDPVSRISVDVFWWSAVAFGLKKEDYCCSVYLAQLYVYCASEGLIIRCNNDWTRKFFPNLFIWQAVCAMAGWYYWTDLRFDAYSVMTKTPDMVAMYLDDVGIQVRWPGKTGTEWHTRTLKITA